MQHRDFQAEIDLEAVAVLPAAPLGPRSIARSFFALVTPWLCSTTAHATLIVTLALVYGWGTRQMVERAVVARPGLEAVFLSSRGQEGGEGADDLGSDPPGTPFFLDEAAAVAQEIGPPRQPAGGGSGSLTALLNEEPKLSFKSLGGVLPASGTGPGIGTHEGSGVGSAQEFTGEKRGASRVRGGYARTGVFGAMAEGRKFIYVFDRSGSMDAHGGAPLGAAKGELIASLKDLDSTHQFQIIFYNEHPRVFDPSGVPGRLVFGTDQNKNLAQRFIGSITADGATRHEAALEMALRMAPDVIFFLTDADEPRLTPEQLQKISRLNRGTSINTIEFGFGIQIDVDNFLVQLARQNAGKHVYVDISKLRAPR